MTKELFYEISQETVVDLEINKEYISDSSIMTWNMKNLDRIKSTPIALNKYFFVDINGSIVTDEYMTVLILLTTYKRGVLKEKFKLGINSFGNAIYLLQDYDCIKFNLIQRGKGKSEIKNIKISEILKFKKLDISSIEFNNTYIQDFSIGKKNIETSDYEKIIENIEKEIIFVKKDNEYISLKPEDFSETQKLITQDRTLLLNIHGFSNCIEYINAYKKTNNINIIYGYYKLIEAWIDNYKCFAKEVDLIYNDMATSHRVANWIRFYNVANKYLSSEQKTKILTSIVYQGNLLEEMHYNNRGTNHGMYQDIASLFYLLSIESKYNKKNALIHTVNNIKKYFEVCISKNGVHIEHSPQYHINIMKNIQKCINVFEKIKIDATDLKNQLKKIERFLIYILKPDEKLPEIGDTASIVGGLKKNIEQISEKEMQNLPLDIVYKDEGYAIFRKSWDKKKDDTYVLFYNAYNSYFHKHSDENGLWIYRNGDIIREAGKKDYNYKEKFTKYAYSSWGHNALIVNKKGLLEELNIPNDYNYDGTYIEDYNITDSNNVWVTGVNARYENVVHKRKVNYNKIKDIVYVSDEITSEKRNKYTLLWQLAPDIIAKINKKMIKLYRDDKLIMTMTLKTKSKYTIRLIKGRTKPRILGWYVDKGKAFETTTIRIDFRKRKNVELMTEFIFEK